MEKTIDDAFFLTDKIVILNKKYLMYENNKIKKITDLNWIKHLGDYGWSKLDSGWLRRLNKNIRKEQRKKTNCWGILDCGDCGDCFFDVVSEGLNQLNYLEDNYDNIYTGSSIREVMAKEINDDNFALIIENYRVMKESGEFMDLWEPDMIKDKEDLQEIMKMKGGYHWGDYISIQLVSEALKINFVILNDEDLDKNKLEERFTIHKLGMNINREWKTMFIFYIDQFHFQLVGYFDNYIMKTVFSYDEIPKEILPLI